MELVFDAIVDRDVYLHGENISKNHKIDFIDALQIATLKYEFTSHLGGDSRTFLVTANTYLAVAATKEGIRAWDVKISPAPNDL